MSDPSAQITKRRERRIPQNAEPPIEGTTGISVLDEHGADPLLARLWQVHGERRYDLITSRARAPRG
jgi:hypothetical protein